MRFMGPLLFQSLIGRLQTCPAEKGASELTMFQSLIGRLQTRVEIHAVAGENTQFQSLIGRLQTCPHSTPPKPRLPFQSLIGRLQTPKARASFSAPGLFQSLIGRLQTHYPQ